MVAPAPQISYAGLGVTPADLLNTYVQTCVNFAQLRTFSGLSNMSVSVLGGAAQNDGLQGVFYWNSTLTNPVDDGVDTIVPTGSVKGAWLRLKSTISSLLLVTIASTGIYTPSANVLFAIVELLGDGAGGGGAVGPVDPSVPPAAPLGAAGGGGGGGAYARAIYSAAQLAAIAPITVAIGLGGAAVVGNDGVAGTGSSFGSVLSAGGGFPGLSSTNGGTGGAGGATTPPPPGYSSIFTFRGYWGQDGFNSHSLSVPPIGGAGGGTFFGGGSQARLADDGEGLTGQDGRPIGAGGGGASILNLNESLAGGTGAAGICLITEYLSL